MKLPRAALASFGFRPHDLDAWLRATLPGLNGIMRMESVGNSGNGRNCCFSFRIRFDGCSMMLRTQPDYGNLLPLASTMRREYRILDALAATDVPVPKPLLYCDDRQVAGAPFYLTRMPEGRVFTDHALTGLPSAQRRGVYFAMAETMAGLHRVDWAAAGLADYGRPTHFFAREIAQWTRKPGANRDMVRLGAWLSAHVPADDETVITHGGFCLGNLVFDAVEPRVIAVSGWERAMLGHPLADVAHSCMPWHTVLRDVDLAAQEIPTQAEYLTHYRQCGGYSEGVTIFHLAFSLFRTAAAKFETEERHGEASALARHAVELIDGCAGDMKTVLRMSM